MNSNTTIGKGFKTLLWVVLSGAITAGLAYISGNPALFNPYVVAAVNILSVLVKNLFNTKVKNY